MMENMENVKASEQTLGIPIQREWMEEWQLVKKTEECQGKSRRGIRGSDVEKTFKNFKQEYFIKLLPTKLDLTFKSSLVVTFSKEQFVSCKAFYLRGWCFRCPNVEK